MRNFFLLAQRGVRAAEDLTLNTTCIVCDHALMTDQDAFCSRQCLRTYLSTVGKYAIDVTTVLRAASRHALGCDEFRDSNTMKRVRACLGEEEA